MTQKWKKIDTAPESVEVETKISDGENDRQERPLVRKGRRWFAPDMQSYIHYTPTHWRKKNGEDEPATSPTTKED